MNVTADKSQGIAIKSSTNYIYINKSYQVYRKVRHFQYESKLPNTFHHTHRQHFRWVYYLNREFDLRDLLPDLAL